MPVSTQQELENFMEMIRSVQSSSNQINTVEESRTELFDDFDDIVE